MNGRSPLPQSHTLPRLCFQPPDCLTTWTPPHPLPSFPSFSTISLAGPRGSFQTPSHLKVHLEAFCDRRRRGRNIGGEHDRWKPVNHDHDAEHLKHPGEGAEWEECTYARYCEAAPCPWGHTERMCGPAQGEKAGISLGYPMHCAISFCTESRNEWGKCKVMTVNVMERRVVEGCYHGTIQDEQPDLEFLSDSGFHGRNFGC